MTKLLAGLDDRARARRRLPARRATPTARADRQLALAGVAMVAVSAAWPVAVTLWPGSKPYIGGSTDGSIWNLIFGYNGFGRLFGEGGGSGGGTSFGGAPGLLRMFNEQVGGQIAWLIPLAAIGLARRPVADAAGPPHGPAPGGAGAVRRLGARARRDLQQPARDLPPVLRQRARAGDRRAVGAGVVMLGEWARRSWAGVAALDLGDRRHGLAGGRAARAHARLRAGAAGRDPGRGGGCRARIWSCGPRAAGGGSPCRWRRWRLRSPCSPGRPHTASPPSDARSAVTTSSPVLPAAPQRSARSAVAPLPARPARR